MALPPPASYGGPRGTREPDLNSAHVYLHRDTKEHALACCSAANDLAHHLFVEPSTVPYHVCKHVRNTTPRLVKQTEEVQRLTERVKEAEGGALLAVQGLDEVCDLPTMTGVCSKLACAVQVAKDIPR
eukprot:Hpha_TRINITY_DN29841_c0_g1::TRINITY_DN29841_c0_g1_i1::g.2915::m.2915